MLPNETFHPLVLGITILLLNECFEWSVASFLYKINWL